MRADPITAGSGAWRTSSSRRSTQILALLREDPVERVFLEDVARRGLGRFAALERGRAPRRRSATPARTSSRPASGCGGFAELRRAGRRADADRRAAARSASSGTAARQPLPAPREDRPGQPVYMISTIRPSRARAGCAPRRSTISTCSCPPAPGARGGARDRPARARRRRLPLADAHADRGGPLLALGRGRRDPLQGRGVRLDARGRAAAAGLDGSRSARSAATASAGCAT